MRVEIGVVYDDGSREVIQAGRPSALIAFADEFGKVAPEGTHVMREAAWLAHRALNTEEPFDQWIARVVEIETPKTTTTAAEAEAEAETEPDAEPDPTAEPELSPVDATRTGSPSLA